MTAEATEMTPVDICRGPFDAAIARDMASAQYLIKIRESSNFNSILSHLAKYPLSQKTNCRRKQQEMNMLRWHTVSNQEI
jgi:hypothetical protein